MKEEDKTVALSMANVAQGLPLRDMSISERHTDHYGPYIKARTSYLLEVSKLVGPTLRIPVEPRNEDYKRGIQYTPYTYMDRDAKVKLMRCYNGLARCAVLEDREEALIWLDEARFLALSTRWALPLPLFEWKHWNLDASEMTKEIMIMFDLSSQVFEKLGNTGTAVDRRWNTGTASLDARHNTPEVERLQNRRKLTELISLRHPDPKITVDAEVTDPELQILGSWMKISVKKQGAMKPRLAFASFIWNGKLYVGGGMGDTKGPFFRDLCCLDLSKPDTWRPLPPFPVSERYTDIWMCWSFSVHDDKAYLFTGKDELDYFDLKKQSWNSVMTSSLSECFQGKGINPWAALYGLKDSSQLIVDHHLYVFGGTHKKCLIGTNFFLRLDFKTMKWKYLSGYFQPGTNADYNCPGPRKTASIWHDESQGRIFLFGGECDRTAAEIFREMHGADCGYAYEDFWSWDVKEEKWRMERMRGNAPCPRSEAACVFNGRLNKAVVFGGYNPACPTKSKGYFPFAYFADTFIYCPNDAEMPSTSTEPTLKYNTAPATHPATNSTGKWKQVLTRGFPTYRAQSQLLTDPKTGKMYLFGGYVNTDWVPSGKSNSSRTFGDVWQLRLDLPGGYFKDVDVEEEARTAKVGPWQRCFACGSAGLFKKCGGSCKGRAFFCDSECLKDGWKEHKRMHECRKVT